MKSECDMRDKSIINPVAMHEEPSRLYCGVDVFRTKKPQSGRDWQGDVQYGTEKQFFQNIRYIDCTEYPVSAGCHEKCIQNFVPNI